MVRVRVTATPPFIQASESVILSRMRYLGHRNFSLRQPMLTIFDSRLASLERVVLAHAARSIGEVRELRTPDLLSPHAVPIPLFGRLWEGHFKLLRQCSRSSVRSRAIGFRGTCSCAFEKETCKVGRRNLARGLQAAAKQGGAQVGIGAVAGTIDARCISEGEPMVGFEQMVQLMCGSEFTLAPSGTFPPTFMIYEAIAARSIPVFAIFPSIAVNPLKSSKLIRGAEANITRATATIDKHMPFYDEGVAFSQFGLASFAPSADSVLRTMAAANVSGMRRRLDAVAHYFTPDGTWDYMVRFMRRRLRVAPNLRASLPPRAVSSPSGGWITSIKRIAKKKTKTTVH